MAKPGGPANTVCHDTVFGLGAGAGNCLLAFAGPGDEVVTKEDSVARGGLVRVGTTGPISVGVDSEGGWHLATDGEPKISRAVQITENPLHS